MTRYVKAAGMVFGAIAGTLAFATVLIVLPVSQWGALGIIPLVVFGIVWCIWMIAQELD